MSVEFLPYPVCVRPPATTANVGPGFDAVGLALSLSDVITAEVTDSGLVVEVEGEGAQWLPRDERHLVVTAARAAFEQLGAQPPGLRIRCQNSIPQARGLGSSAAAIVGGILAARALTVDGPQRLSDAAVLRLATRLDGHPDNVAACLLGGATIAWCDAVGESERARAVRIPLSPAITPVVYVPEQQSLTHASRAVLPAEVSFADAAANAGRSALLVHALSVEPSLLLPATEDRLHQKFRAALMPRTAECVAALRAAEIPAVVSGAGPSVFAMLVFGQQPLVCDGFAVHPLSFDPVGAAASVTAMVSVSRVHIGS